MCGFWRPPTRLRATFPHHFPPICLDRSVYRWGRVPDIEQVIHGLSSLRPQFGQHVRVQVGGEAVIDWTERDQVHGNGSHGFGSVGSPNAPAFLNAAERVVIWSKGAWELGRRGRPNDFGRAEHMAWFRSPWRRLRYNRGRGGALGPRWQGQRRQRDLPSWRRRGAGRSSRICEVAIPAGAVPSQATPWTASPACPLV
jgi:hypothetical protein